MNMLTNRRRGYSKEVKRIMTHKTNNLMLTTCYNAGWVRNNRYMTKKEALAVTNIGTTFKSITTGSNRTFREFKYFTGLTTLPNLSFYSSTKLTAIELPNSITTIGTLVFRYSNISGTLELPSSITTIGSNAFDSTKLSKVIVPNSVVSCANLSFNNIATVKWNSQLNPHLLGGEYGDSYVKNATKYESDIHTVVDDMLVTDNGTTLLACPLKKSLSDAIFLPGVTKIARTCFLNCSSGSLSRIPEGITEIGDFAFMRTCSINNGIIILPNSLINIPDNMRTFQNSNIKAVYFPSTINRISGFAGSTLTNKICVIDSTVAKPANIYALSTTVASYGKWIIYVPEGYKNTVIPPSTHSFIRYPYYNDTNIRELPSWFDNSSYDSIEQGLNALRSRESRRMDCTYTKQNVTPTTLFSAITNIEEMMIDWKTVTLSATYTFPSASGTCAISPILIDKTFIEDSMFQNVTAVTSVTLNSATISIGKHSFDGCTALTTINLTNVTTIDNYAFKDCSAITTLNVAKVTTIGEHAFENCTGLTTLTLTAILTIGNSAFTGCTNLDLTTIDAIMAINEHAFD